MAKETKGGRRLSGAQSSSYTGNHNFPTDDTIAFSGTQGGTHSTVDDAVVDEILRSISDQSETPVPNMPNYSARRPYSTNENVSQQTQTAQPRFTADNSYAAAARAYHADDTQMVSPRRGDPSGRLNTGSIPDPAYYAMRDPAQTQSFQPARPAHRDTDRIPTLVEEKPVRRKSPVGRVLTFLVTILVIVAIVLAVRMVYILGPSMGWDLPDLSQLPGISALAGMLPEEETGETVGNETDSDEQTEEDEDTTVVATPTSVTLDQETLSLSEGGVAIITATTDTDWTGTVVWATSDETVATVTSIGDMIAQVEYVGEGTCSIAAVIPAGVDQEGPSAYCRVTCAAASTGEDTATEDATTDTDTAETETSEVQSVDVVLNRDDFTLAVGERHQLMDENADQVTWSSSDTSVATVSESGIVTAVSPGTATITATGPDGTTASAIARVKS